MTACQFLKGEIKGSETRQREEMKAGEARQREALLDVKGEVKSLGDKLDSLLVLMAKGTTVPTVGHDR